MPELLNDLLECEALFWESAGDQQRYEGALAEEALMVFPAPFGIIDRERILETVAMATPWARYRIEEPQALALGEQAASLSYRAVARRDGDADDYRAWITSVYVREGGRWKLALHQQTPITGD